MTPSQCAAPPWHLAQSPCSPTPPSPPRAVFTGFVCGEDSYPEICGGAVFCVSISSSVFRLCQFHYPALQQLLAERDGGADVTPLPPGWALTVSAMLDVQALLYGCPWAGVTTDLPELINAAVCLRLPDLRDTCIREVLRPECIGQVSPWWQESERFPESVVVTRRVLIHAISRRYSLLDVKPLLHDIRTVRRADVERFVTSGEMLEIVSRYFLDQFICKVNRWVAEGDLLRVWRLLANCGHVLTQYGLEPGSFLYQASASRPCPNRQALVDMARLLHHSCLTHSPSRPLFTGLSQGPGQEPPGDTAALTVPLHSDPEILHPNLVIFTHPEPCIRPWEGELSRNSLRILALPLSDHNWQLTIGLYPEKLRSSSNIVTMEHFVMYSEWRPNSSIRRLTMCSLRWHGESDILVWTPKYLSNPSWKYQMRKQGLHFGTVTLTPSPSRTHWGGNGKKAGSSAGGVTSALLALDGSLLYEFAQTPFGSVITTFDLQDMEVGPKRHQGTTTYSDILTFEEQQGPEIYDRVLCVVARLGLIYIFSLNANSVILAVWDVDAARVVNIYNIRKCNYEVRASRAIFIKNDLYLVTSVGEVLKLSMSITGELLNFKEILHIPQFGNRKDFHLACHFDWLYVFGSEKKTRSIRKTACYGVNVEKEQLSVLSLGPPFASVIGGAVLMLSPFWTSPVFPPDVDNLEWRHE